MAEVFETDVTEITLTRRAITNMRLPPSIGNGIYEILEKDTIPVAVWVTEI